MRTGERFLSLVNAQVPPQSQFRRELPVTQRATETRLLPILCRRFLAVSVLRPYGFLRGLHGARP